MDWQPVKVTHETEGKQARKRRGGVLWKNKMFEKEQSKCLQVRYKEDKEEVVVHSLHVYVYYIKNIPCLTGHLLVSSLIDLIGTCEQIASHVILHLVYSPLPFPLLFLVSFPSIDQGYSSVSWQVTTYWGETDIMYPSLKRTVFILLGLYILCWIHNA